MKATSILCLLCFVWQFMTAQTNTTTKAPDFIITTTDGTMRHLYADYLDQNKTVVLFIFNTISTGSLNIAPLIETLYQEWDGGKGPIEIIGLSNLENDTNEKIRRFRTMTGNTFPSAGDDGGSMEAALPYVNGTFGKFVRTPTFAVITPNKTVTYDLRSNSDQATIDSIDYTLRQMGIEKPAISFTHTGTVILGDSIGVADVSVQVRNTDMDIVATDSAGAFNFNTPLVAGNYYNLQFRKKGSVTNGVTTFDLVKLQRHLLGIEPFSSPYQLIAGDIDRSGSISILDVILLRKLVLSIETTLPNNISWIFINSDYKFITPEAPFNEVYVGEATYFNYTAKKRTLPPFKVIAIKIGDVNFSAR